VAESPSGVCTVTSTVPTVPAGAVTLSEVDDSRVKLAGVEPNST